MKFRGPVAVLKQMFGTGVSVPERHWPMKYLGAIKPTDVVQVLMTEEMARNFEMRCLGVNTRGDTKLSVPLLFRQDDLPTYSIDTAEAGEWFGR